MDPLTIILLGGAAVLVVLGLKKNTVTSQAQQQTQQGASVIAGVGNAGSGITGNLSNVNTNIKSTELKAVTGSIAGGVSAGSAAASGGAAAGSAATIGAVTAGIGIAVGVALVLWAKHEARIKAAKSENEACNLIVPAWVETIHGIINTYNAGNITDLQAKTELQQLRQLVFDNLQRYNHVAGVDWAGGGTQLGFSSRKYWNTTCDKHCTIGCCLFNNVIGPGTNNAIDLVSHKIPSKTITIPKMAPNSTYGFKGVDSFSLAVTK